MGHWIKHLSLKSGDLSSSPQNPCKAGPSDHICNPSAPAVRWEAETGDSVLRPAGTQESLTNKMEGER